MRLNEKLSFQEPITISDGLGGGNLSWKERFCTAAKINYSRATEISIETRVAQVLTIEIIIYNSRQSKMITNHWRIVDARNSNLTYNIASIVPHKNPRFLIITAQTGGADG